MGVTNLWQILSPVQEHQSLASLEGLVLAVDLSIWICESDGVKYMQGVVCKPYLRNLFFRIIHLTQIGVKLVFVIDGTPPDLKWEVMAKRQQARFPGRQGKQTTAPKPPTKQTRKNFNAIIKECCELLDMLGTPYIQSKGEAEAMCALLNSSGLVDGCLTDDGDAFLYGAQTVYRNFTMNLKDPHVERYRYRDIETQLGIDRNGLVALALLIGCDFIPKGVPGVGMANAIKLLDCLKGRNVLERLKDWRRIHESQCLDPVEKMVRVKALSAPDFPQVEVINEFLQPKDRCPSRLSSWKRPVPVKLQNFALSKLEWPVEYTLEKILPLVTLWDMQDALQSRNPCHHQHLKPHRIVKTRIRQGVPCYEIEWFKPVTDPYHEGDYYVTIETQDMFAKCYPTIVQNYFGETNSKNKKKKAKKKKAKEKPVAIEEKTIDNLSFNFGKLNIRKVTHKLQESLHALHPSFTDYEEAVLTTKVKQSTLSQTSNKINVASNQCENSVNVETAKEVKQWQAVNSSKTESSDDLEMPFSDRIKLRLQKKKQKQITSEKETFSSVINMPDGLSLPENHSSGKRRKRKKKSGKAIENSVNNSDSFRGDISTHLSVDSPRSPFVCSSAQPSSANSRKMSSPAANAFCSPASYIKQSLKEDGNVIFKDSPIQNNTADHGAARKQKTTSTNFKFFETPNRGSSPSVNFKATSEMTQGSSNLNTDKDSTPSMLKESWQTEYIENYFNELSKELSFSVNGNLKTKKPEKSTSSTVHQNQNNYPSPGQQQVCESNSRNQSSFKINPAQLMNETQEMNFGEFELQSSLLNSLCASLIQTLTPKGMNKEQYDSLCESLKKIEQGGKNLDTDLRNIVTENVACNIDFAEIEEVSSKLSRAFTPKSIKPINLAKRSSEQNTAQFKYDVNDSLRKVDGLSKSARKRLRKKQMKSVDITANYGTESKEDVKSAKTIKMNNSNSLNQGRSFGNTVADSISNGNFPHNQDSGMKTNHIQSSSKGAKYNGDCDRSANISTAKHNGQIMSQKNSNLGNSFVGQVVSQGQSGNENIINQENKKKRKNKKKKLRKASAEMDLSVETSEWNESMYKNCSEYLQKALSEKQKSLSQTKKIEKASPLIDLSADDTFLELEVLSSCLSGSTVSTNSDAKRKLALKKKLSKRQTVSDTMSTVSEPFNGASTTEVKGHLGSPESDPVLSINAALSSLSLNTDTCEKSDEMKSVLDDHAVSPTTCKAGDETEHDRHFEVNFVNKEKSVQIGNTENNADEWKWLRIHSPTVKKTKQAESRSCSNANDEDNLYEIEREIMSPKSQLLSDIYLKNEKRGEVECCKRKSASVIKHANIKLACKRSKELSDVSDVSANTYNPHHKPGRRQHCCRLEIGPSQTEVYERNIQTCKDLTSWSQLPTKSTSDRYVVKKAENSVRLNLGLGLHSLHRHANDYRQKGTTGGKLIENYGRDLDNGLIATDGEVNCLNHERKYDPQDPEIINMTSNNEETNTCYDSNLFNGAEIDSDSLDTGDNESLNSVEIDSEVFDSVEIDCETLGSRDIESNQYICGKFDSVAFNGAESEELVDEKMYGDKLNKGETGFEKLDNGEADSEQANSLSETDEIDKELAADKESFDNQIVMLDPNEQCKDTVDNGMVIPDDHTEPSPITEPSSFIVSMGTSKSRSSSDAGGMSGTCIYISDIQFYSEDCDPTQNGVKQSIDDPKLNSSKDDPDKEVEKEFVCKYDADTNYENGLANTDDVNITNGLAEHYPEFGKNTCSVYDTEGLSDKENEKVEKRCGDLTVSDLSDPNMAVNLTEEESVGHSNSSRLDERNSVERTSSPVPLLDRLKMKFKKSSARSVLHSFTNGR